MHIRTLNMVKRAIVLVIFSTLLLCGRVCAGQESSDGVSWILLVTGLLGGLALFLFGMVKMRHKKMASINTHEVHMALMDILKQVIVYSSNIAKTFLLKCGPIS